MENVVPTISGKYFVKIILYVNIPSPINLYNAVIGFSVGHWGLAI